MFQFLNIHPKYIKNIPLKEGLQQTDWMLFLWQSIRKKTRTLIRPKSGEQAKDYLLCSFCLAFFVIDTPNRANFSESRSTKQTKRPCYNALWKITHFEKNFQRASNLEPIQRTFKKWWSNFAWLLLFFFSQRQLLILKTNQSLPLLNVLSRILFIVR